MTKPILFDFVYTLYTSASQIMPEFMKDKSMFSAFSMAALGTFGFTKLAQYISKNYVNKIIPDFDKNYLPKLEKACQYGLPAIALLHSAIDPDGAKAILMEHPVCTAGMSGAFAGCFVAAQQDLNKKVSLENKL